ncbi:MAG: hypothetical protein J2P14_17210, partial [Acidothermales bacterium]|nr:hypothetical protein [Acidothermales bacterium]
IERKQPALTDRRRQYPTIRTSDVHDLSVISQGGVLYLPALDRYVYTSWTGYTFEFYEAPKPWGPWRLFMTKDLGGYPWFGMGGTCPGPKNGGYATTIPSKFVAADGRSMWLQCNWFVGNSCGDANYHFSLRKMRLEPFVPAKRTNSPDPKVNLARTGAGVTTIEKSAHFGHGAFYNDGDPTNSEDSFDQEDKTLDWWGFTWPRPYNVDRVVYTTGQMFGDGGWFSGDLRVQVRQQFRWIDVADARVDPAYPNDAVGRPEQVVHVHVPEHVGRRRARDRHTWRQRALHVHRRTRGLLRRLRWAAGVSTRSAHARPLRSTAPGCAAAVVRPTAASYRCRGS